MGRKGMGDPLRTSGARVIQNRVTAKDTGARWTSTRGSSSVRAPMTRFLYLAHRWISLAALLQLAAWTVSGTFFAIVPFARVRGASVAGAHQSVIPDPEVVSVKTVMATLAARGIVPTSIELRATPDGVFYLLRAGDDRARLDARTGGERPVDRAEAEAIARRDQPGAPTVRNALLISSNAAIEYRERPLPAWRVALSDAAGTVIYVDAISGDVTARRNDLWRTYDFLWSLHIMNYGDRDRFDHPLLAGFGFLGVFTVLSGATLWIVRMSRAVRRRLGRGGGAPAGER